MEAPVMSAFAAWGAAAVAASVAAIQFYIGRKQAQAALTSAQAALMNAQNAGRHTVAEFRQKWIDKVIDVLSEHNAILLNRLEETPLPLEERKELTSLRTRLEILLNPSEADTIELLRLIDEVPAISPATAREVKSREAIQVARRLLKKEWVRLKSELQADNA